MVYSSLELNDEDTGFSVQRMNTEPFIQVKFNNSGIHQIAGPVPFVNLSKSFNRNGAGNSDNIQTNVTLTGKIVRTPSMSSVTPPGTGTDIILQAVKDLQKLFNCSSAKFEIVCNGTGLIVDGARVNSFSCDKSNDNWNFTADYTVELEYNEHGLSGYPPIRNGSDSWSIEPVAEQLYSNWTTPINSKAEYHNPKLKTENNTPVTPITEQNPLPVDNNLSIYNIPQYNITRRLSAVGISTDSSCYSSGDYSAFLNAKNWIDIKLAESFKTSNSGIRGMVTLTKDNYYNLNSFDKLFLFNHLRTVNFSVSDGSYDVTETWLAMPTGISYTEDYSIETATDEKFIRTVRVQGNVKGLSFIPINIMSGGNDSLPPSGKGKINLDHNAGITDRFSGNSKILDLISTNSYNTTYIQSNKYENALSGWINDIKPYLYRRASLVLQNFGDRSFTSIDPITTPQPAPKNPIYCSQSPLNIIPISTTEGHDPRKGTISYNYEYTNKHNFISGVLSENITINDTGPVDVIAESFVIGRRLGPVLQNLGARTSARKDISIEINVLPPSSLAGFMITNKECPLWTGGTVYKTITGIIEGFKPFGDRLVSIFGNMSNDVRLQGQLNNSGQVFINTDNYTWNPTEGRYTRSIGWTYQTCNISRSYMDS